LRVNECAIIDGREKFERRCLLSLKGYAPSALAKAGWYRVHQNIELQLRSALQQTRSEIMN
jgi:hypothetical protein